MTTAEPGLRVDLASCESEPIHTPGFIQPHGVLLALNPTTFIIEQASENSAGLLARTPQDLIGKSPAVFLGDRQFEQLALALSAPSFETGVGNVLVGPGNEPMECVYSRYRDSLLIEFQPTDTVHSIDNLDVSLRLQAPMSRMERTSSIDDLAVVAVKEIRAISGFDRVMVYRFDHDWHGQVVAESVSDRVPVAYLGMHFPASDIPAQARELYLLNTLRLIPDTDYVPVPIVPARSHPTLDLSRSDLRSVSPIHIEYLHNIGVRATLTISVIVHGQLWGLVACHHDSPRRLTHVVRATCNFFAQILALKLTARVDQTALSERLNATEQIAKFVADMDSTQSLWEALRLNWVGLIAIFAADAVLVRDSEGSATYGTSVSAEDLRTAIARLQDTAADGIASTSSLCALDDKTRAFAAEVSGALYVGLSTTTDRCITFLRREQSASMTWAGAPNQPAVATAGKPFLSPRSSFAAWEEVTHGESIRWSGSDLAAAAILRDQLKNWQKAHEQVHLLAHYDALTELPNRRLLDEILRRSLKTAEAENGRVGMLFIDVDRFKRFNDRLGHAAGDRVLRHVGRRITRAVREGDIVGRIGGDEFVVIMPTLPDRVAAEGIAQRLLDEVSQPVPGFEGPDLRVTLSIGISVFPDDGGTSDELFNTADTAMYRAKATGRSAWQSYESGLGSASGDSAKRAKRVGEALDRGEIIAHFQPVVDLRDGRVVAFEALARWNHPVTGLTGPAAFIDIAEETGLIVRLGEAILDQACRQVSRWRRTIAPSLRIAVNVSPLQLRDFGFVKMMRTILGRYDLPAEALEIEITEGMMLGESAQSIEALRELSEAGVRLAIDDFGTGYSSFSYLRLLPVTSLKIDQSFVAELNAPKTLESGTTIIRGIISMAKGLGLEVVAEGVETRAQFELLRAEGCHFGQGYYLGRPLGAAAYSTFAQVAATDPYPP
jgi:diguanylate cyclase (GGDEF)-like protein